jgi:hypothetical protein
MTKKTTKPAADIKGRFKPGNTIGKETRFKAGNTFASKYEDRYCDMMLEYFRNEASFPTIEEFTDKINVLPSTIWTWCKAHPRFKDTVDVCKNIQKSKLMKNGLSGRYNAQFTKFLLSVNHDMREKVETDNTVTFKVALSEEVDEESN